MVVEKFQVYSVKFTANTFVSQKLFTHAPKQIPTPGLFSSQTRISHFSQTAFFEEIFSWGERMGEGGAGGRIMEFKK